MITSLLKLFVGIAIVVFVIIVGPLCGIWAFNVFGEYLWPGKIIPYTLETWAAFAILFGSVTGLSYGSKRA